MPKPALPGLLLAIAACATVAWAQSARVGTVATVVGAATVARGVSQQPLTLRLRDDVFLHDRITTGERSFLRVLLGGKATVTYKKPEQKEFDNIQKCVVRGLEEADTAIKYDPNSESAWSYKTNLLIEEAKIADMNGEAEKKAQYTRQAEVAAKRESALAEERRKKEEAAEKAASPTP